MRGAGGEKSQKHHEGQLWPTDPKLPSSQKKAVSSVTKLLLHGRAPSSVPQTPQLEFASLSQQMTCRWTAHLAASPPPLSKREREKKKNKERKEKENDKSGLCVIWQACLRGLDGSLPSERLPETPGERRSTQQNPGELTGQRAALSTGCFNFLL